MPELKTLKHSDLVYRHWNCANPKAILFLIHGLGAHSERWNYLASFLALNDFESWALELKGFGETSGPRGHIDSFKTYYRDIVKLYAEIKKQHPHKKIFILGESLGGLLALVSAELNPNMFSGLVLISPAFKSALKFKFNDYLGIFSALLFNPRKAFKVPFNSAMCTRDETYQKIMDSDKRELRVASAKLLFNTLLEQMRAKQLIKMIRIPVLLLSAGKDYLVDTKENRKIFDKLIAKDKILIDYPEMQHALSIELEREKVFFDLLKWLKERV